MDGLGLLGFESIVNRDYPVVFATVYIFSLMGLHQSARTSPIRGSIRASISRRAKCEIMDAPTDTAIVEQLTAGGLPKVKPWFSALQRRRWDVFKANRRGFWSLWIFLALFTISLFAEFIANDKPILVSYKGELYMPIFKAYPETAFGGIFETEADYRDPAVKGMIADAGGWTLWPPIRFSYNTQNKNRRWRSR